MVAQEAWVLDTAYGAWLDVVLPRVQLVVALDYPRWFSLQRLIRRTLMRAIDQRPICNGNTESLRNLCSRDSIVAWHFRSFDRKRSRIRQWAEATDGPPVLRLHAGEGPGAVDRPPRPLRDAAMSARRPLRPCPGAPGRRPRG